MALVWGVTPWYLGGAASHVEEAGEEATSTEHGMADTRHVYSGSVFLQWWWLYNATHPVVRPKQWATNP